MSMMGKAQLANLAVFGGERLFEDDLPVAQVYLPRREEFDGWFGAIFDRAYYTNHGPLVSTLERAVRDRLGVRHAIAVTNGTVALMVALTALDISGEVVVPSFTFPATVQALKWSGLGHVFADVDADTHMLTPDLVEAVRTPETTGVLGVHVWGRPCAPESMEDYCRRHRIALLFDACHAFGCGPVHRLIGNYGSAEIFSFHATKIVNAAEGGCIVTNDDDLAARIRTVRSFHRTPADRDVRRRLNAKMSEAQAAMALMSLGSLEHNIAANGAVLEVYRSGLRDIPGLNLVEPVTGLATNHQYCVVEVSETSALDRDGFLLAIRPEGVLARRYFAPGVHRLAPYSGSTQAPLPNTERLCRTLLQLPLGAQVSPDQARWIVDLLAFVAANAGNVARRLEQLAPEMPGASR